MITALLAIHIAAGSIALASMVVPMASRKGGTLHRRAGWVFVAAMAAVSLTALILSGHRFLFDTRPEARDFGLFLFFVSILTAASVSAGVRVLSFKHRTAAHLHWWDTGLPALLTLASVGMGGYGWLRGEGLFMGFAVIGLATGIGGLRYWLRAPTSRMHWWFQHLGSMLGGCIAATTAFLVVSGDNFGIWPMAAWFGPSVVGTIAIGGWTAYYRRRMTSRYFASSGCSDPLYART